jgi:uncharacterized protein (DUF305 family)
MRRWLSVHGGQVGANQHQEHAAGHGLMPGMLTAEELARLAAAKGGTCDRLFLEFMIRHHEGALTMVQDLFSVAGAGQEPELYRFASDVDAEQRAEIARMRKLLTTLQ